MLLRLQTGRETFAAALGMPCLADPQAVIAQVAAVKDMALRGQWPSKPEQAAVLLRMQDAYQRLCSGTKRLDQVKFACCMRSLVDVLQSLGLVVLRLEDPHALAGAQVKTAVAANALIACWSSYEGVHPESHLLEYFTAANIAYADR